MADPQLRLIVLRTPKLEELCKFYAALGLRLAEEQHEMGPKHFSCTFQGMVLELYPSTKASEPGRVGFAVESLSALLERLLLLGTPIVEEPARGPWGLRCLVRDPDGRVVELYEH